MLNGLWVRFPPIPTVQTISERLKKQMEPGGIPGNEFKGKLGCVDVVRLHPVRYISLTSVIGSREP